MSISHDSVFTENIRTGTTDPHTFSHTPGADLHGVYLLAAAIGLADLIVGVTYGGDAMTRVRFQTADTAEDVSSYIYFLGTSIPTGTQTVSIDFSSATTVDFGFVVGGFISSNNLDIELVDNDGLGALQADPQVTLNHGGRECADVCVLSSGNAAPSGTLVSGTTAVHSQDMGAWMCQSSRNTTPGTSDQTMGWTLVAEDAALSAAAFAEKPFVAPGLISQTAATFSPTINPGSVSVSPGLISQTAAVFAPSIAEGAASQGVTAGLISQLAATFSPTITPGAVTVAPSLVGVAASVFAPGIEVGDAPTFGGGLATIIRKSRRR